MNAPKTVANYAIGSSQDGSRVKVWDNELDDVLLGTVRYVNDLMHRYTVELDATEWQEARKIVMRQGPYTDNGRFRIVEVLR